MKIFLASNPDHPNHNLATFYSKLTAMNGVNILHPTTPDEVEGNIPESLAQSDRLKVLQSELLIYDNDSNPGIHYIIWASVKPDMRVVVISKSLPILDPYFGERVIAVLKPIYLLDFLGLFLDKSGPTHVEESGPTHDEDPEPKPES